MHLHSNLTSNIKAHKFMKLYGIKFKLELSTSLKGDIKCDANDHELWIWAT